MGCLSCHANVQANVLTDYGYGNAWYLDQDKANYASPSKIFTQGYYTPFVWQALHSVAGEVVTPAAAVPENMVAASIPAGRARLILRSS